MFKTLEILLLCPYFGFAKFQDFFDAFYKTQAHFLTKLESIFRAHPLQRRELREATCRSILSKSRPDNTFLCVPLSRSVERQFWITGASAAASKTGKNSTLMDENANESDTKPCTAL